MLEDSPAERTADDVASGTRIVESELRFEKEVVLRVSVEPRSSAQACG